MDKTTRKRLEDKFEELAEQVSAELEAGLRENLEESIEILQKTEDSASKLTALIDLKWKPGNDQLQVVLTWTAEGKLKTKSEPFGFNFNLGASQGTLPGMDAKDDAIDVPDETPQARLLSAPPKQLPAPEDVVEGEVAEPAETPEPEFCSVPSDTGAVKIKTVTLSSTSYSDFSIDNYPNSFRSLTTDRKAGLCALGDVVQIVLKNPDDKFRRVMGFYRCTAAEPVYPNFASSSRTHYIFTKLEDEENQPEQPAAVEEA